MESLQEWNVGELLDTSSSYWKSCTIHAGVKLELFTQLNNSKFSAVEIAQKINGDERGVCSLLNALKAMELLQKENDRFSNTAFSKKYLDKNSEDYQGHIIMHHHHLVDGWAQLDHAVLTGHPVETRSYGEEKERESFQLGMFNLAMAIAPKLAEQVDLEGKKRLLDLGGGPGTHAIHFCMANPELTATIYDRPTTRDFAMQTVKQFGLEDRIDFAAGDFNIDLIEGTYDVAWLSHILHSNGPEECEKLIEKTKAAMEPGGLIMIHDFFLNDTNDGPLFPALFSLNMLLNNELGRSYSEREAFEMLGKAGIKAIHRLPFQSANDSYVLCGTV